MKYLPTVNLWDNTTQEAIKSGQIKLQVGQWCRCGTEGKRCRYVSHTKNSINVVHWQGSSKLTNELFKRRLLRLNQNKVE
jgi:hypothetical protein